MARRYLTPRLNRLYRDATEGLINDFSKRSTVYLFQIAEVVCPNCVIDSRDGSSTGSYKDGGPTPFTGQTCPVCEGSGKISSEKRIKLSANIQWGKTQKDNEKTTAGELPEGKVRLKTFYRHFKTLANLKDQDYFLVDSIRCKLEGEPKPGGLQNYVTVTAILRVEK